MKIKSAVFLVFLIAIDQLIKYIIRASGGFYICNRGVAFGISPLKLLFIILLLCFFFIFYSLISNYKCQISNQVQSSKSKNFVIWIWDLICHRKFDIGASETIAGIGIILVISGGISNVIDRLIFGCVIDFIDLKFWPVFNLADVYISLGAIILAGKLLKAEK